MFCLVFSVSPEIIVMVLDLKQSINQSIYLSIYLVLLTAMVMMMMIMMMVVVVVLLLIVILLRLLLIDDYGMRSSKVDIKHRRRIKIWNQILELSRCKLGI